MHDDKVIQELLNELGIESIRISLPFRLDHVNCFMAKGEEGWIVIDTGLHNEKSVAAWDEHLKDREIGEIIITHHHQDHYGYAGGMQNKTGARVAMTQRTVNLRVFWEDSWFKEVAEHYHACGIPKEYIDQMIQYIKGAVKTVSPHPKVNHILEEGDRIVLGNYEYEVIITYGHAEGMICLYNKEKNVLFPADHILPGITPNVSYRFIGDQNPIASFQKNLKKVRKLNAEWVIPSHGRPFYDCNRRIDELLAHHEERLEKTMDILHEDSTIYEVAMKLFNRKLTVHEMRAAIGETLAHLMYLYHQGDCKKNLVQGKWIYKL
jgi:glyoxylase-like metal-dependent hydrolase (beta-lactamase superfamily II)